MSPKIILASKSAARIAMLRAAGVEFTAQPAAVDEEAVKVALLDQQASPRDVADALAEMKAARLSNKTPEAVVIGADQVLECDGRILSKPANTEAAIAQLLDLRSRQHRLLSAAVIMRDGRPVWRHVAETRLWMRDFSDQFLEDYIARVGADVLDTVGAYRLEDYGVRLFSRIEGDHFTVLGMPLVEILNYLATAGVLQK